MAEDEESNQRIAQILAQLFGFQVPSGDFLAGNAQIADAVVRLPGANGSVAPFRANYGSLDMSGIGKNPLLKLASMHLGEGATANNRDLMQFFQATLGRGPTSGLWCADFANAVLVASGLPQTGSAMARSFLNYGTEARDPEFGDLVVLKRGSDGVSGHVGFYMGAKNGKIFVLGGNQGDKVSIEEFSQDDVLSIRHPPAPSVVTPKPTEQIVPASATNLQPSNRMLAPMSAA